MRAKEEAEWRKERHKGRAKDLIEVTDIKES